jgi:hypothetical protein
MIGRILPYPSYIETICLTMIITTNILFPGCNLLIAIIFVLWAHIAL